MAKAVRELRDLRARVRDLEAAQTEPIAVVGVGASVVLSGDKSSFVSARIAVGAVAPTPLFVSAAGEALAGEPVSDETIQRAADIARDAARPISDMRGTAEYRKHLTSVLTRRVVQGAVQRAKE